MTCEEEIFSHQYVFMSFEVCHSSRIILTVDAESSSMEIAIY